jgi:hypothetical protein
MRRTYGSRRDGAFDAFRRANIGIGQLLGGNTAGLFAGLFQASRGGVGNVAGGLGTSVGSALTLAGMPQFGLPIAIGSQLLGGLFGAKKTAPPAGYAQGAIDEYGRLGGVTGSSYRGGDEAGARAALQPIATAVAAILGATGGRIEGGAQAIESELGGTKRLKYGGSYYALDEAGQTEIARTILGFSTGRSAAIDQRLASAGGLADFQALASEIGQARALFDTFTAWREPLTQTEAAVKSLKAEFERATAAATLLGRAQGDVSKAYDQQMAYLRQEYGAGLDVRLARVEGRGQDAELLEFDRAAVLQRREAAELGAELLARTEEVLGRERAAIVKRWADAATEAAERAAQAQKEAADRAAQAAAEAARERAAALDRARSGAADAIGGVTAYVRQLQTSEASALPPERRLDLARRQFQAVSGAAAAGDAASAGRVTSYADAWLGAAREVFGSGAGYAEVFDRVVSELGRVADRPDQLTASFLALETRTQTETLVAAVERLQGEIRDLRGALTQVGSRPGRIAA